jgi:hypothetical protein
VTLSRPVTLPSGECLQVNAVRVEPSCPVGVGVSRDLSFDVTAQTSRSGLQWRRAATSSDVLLPAVGELATRGTTSVSLRDIVLDGAVTLEIVDGSQVLLTVTVRSY